MKHYVLPPLPPEYLYRIPVEPTAGFRDGEFRVRARDAAQAVRRARAYMGLTPTVPAERIEEADDG